MVQGRSVRTRSRNKMIQSESKEMEAQLTEEMTDCSPSVKSRRITDYFQPVEAPEAEVIKQITPVRCTRSKAHFLPEPQEDMSSLNGIKMEEQLFEEENNQLPSIHDRDCGLKSPPSTPHRITLCTEILGVKMEAKSFQKPIKPKARRKLNINRFNVLEETNANRKISVNNFLPVRKSVRKTKTTVLEEKQRLLEKILRDNVEEGLKISYFDGKGRGIVADKDFKRGDFVVEYSGDLIEISEAKKREEMYAANNAGCYMYYFEHNSHKYCIDATPESDRLGRLVNHSRNGNLMTKSVSVDGKPRLVLLAKEDIDVGQELLYDYGDRSRESLKHHPWLAY